MNERTPARRRTTARTTPPGTPAAPARNRTRRAAGPQRPRPAWLDPSRMSGAVLASAGSSLLITALGFLAQHVEVTWR
ncbi:hypothetical protein [Streptomyces sp. CBMA156]|uniref:hypothetical protein n=1 Tax=Streptomyces sp. CBMA156 TaxID=1930280 RepID=UPI001661A321|nr:hypothetical protein [Streptomyces sp. CBMA156]MBD0675472.1 hypothetical protein [Streptomyces sp. CBMA156]